MPVPVQLLCRPAALRPLSTCARTLAPRPAFASPRFLSSLSPHLHRSSPLSLSPRPRARPACRSDTLRLLATSPTPPKPTPPPSAPDDTSAPLAAASTKSNEARENPYTIPNAITVARMAACPVIGYYILEGDLSTATALLFVAGVSDLVRPFPLLETLTARPRADVSSLLSAGGWVARAAVQHGLGPRQHPGPGGRQAPHDDHGHHARHARHAPSCVLPVVALHAAGASR